MTYNKASFNKLIKRAENLLIQYYRTRQSNQVMSEIYKLLDDLTVAYIELEIQNEDLIAVQMELEGARHGYAELYELAPIAYFTLDENGKVLNANTAACTILNIDKNLLQSMYFCRFIGTQFQIQFSQLRKQTLLDLTAKTCKVEFRKYQDTTVYYAQVEAKAIINTQTGSKQVLVCMMPVINYN